MGNFTKDELADALKNIKNRKAAGLDNISPEVGKIQGFSDIFLDFCSAVYNQKSNGEMDSELHFIFSQKSDVGIVKNYSGSYSSSRNIHFLTFKSYAISIKNCEEIKMHPEKINQQFFQMLISP